MYGVAVYKLRYPGPFACNVLDASADGKQLSFVLWCGHALAHG